MPDAQIQRDKPLVGATALFVVAGLAFLGIEVLEGEQERFEQALAALVAGASGLFVVVRGWYLRASSEGR